MRCNEMGRQLIRDCEGLRLKAYKDSAGIWTVGYGHTGKDVQPGSKIDEHTAEILLAQDIAVAEKGVGRLVYVPLNENQFSALCSFVFNLGEGRLRHSNTIRLLNKKRYLEFADALLKWNKCTMPDGTKKELPGLTKRRKRERELFLRPVLV